MRILIYEHLTACNDPALPASLRAEGGAMLRAVAADFAACPQVEVVELELGRSLVAAAAAAEAVLLIAPESGGVLAESAAMVERTAARLLSPPAAFCRWAGDKSQVAATMHAAGVPMSRGRLLAPGEAVPSDFPLPAVLKPNDGCGSQGVFLLPAGSVQKEPHEIDLSRSPSEPRMFVSGPPSVEKEPNRLQTCAALKDTPAADIHAISRAMLPAGEAMHYRIEAYVPGAAVSVALLGGPAGVFPLPACSQRLSDDGTFAYLGGACPLEPAPAARAERLALRAAAAMPAWCGYIGLDLVLGAADDGSGDYLIEVNPRLTTSYVGLRALSRTNLAAAMLDVAAGRSPQLSFRPERVVFDCEGNVSYA